MDKTEIHITTCLSSSKIITLIDENPNLKKITCSKSIYNRISKKYIEALNDLDIEVAIAYNQGRKSKNPELEKQIVLLAKNKKTPKEISEILEIPIKQVYNLLNKNKISLNNYKRKYDLNQRNHIKSLKNKGLSAKDIASELNMPIRSVYYILNNK